jgi:putative Holliday junction resolvase
MEVIILSEWTSDLQLLPRTASHARWFDVDSRGWQILAVPSHKRVLGLDVGSRTIGVAVTDELGVAAHPVCTIARKGTQADVASVLALAQKYGSTRAVMGMPYDEEGGEGPRAKRVRVFLDALEAAGLPVEPWDERFSTIEAEAVLLEANLSRKKRKQVIDRLAAQVILENWLGAQ